MDEKMSPETGIKTKVLVTRRLPQTAWDELTRHVEADLWDYETPPPYEVILEKVKGIVELFPGSQLMIEGHTDAQGDAAANVTLSEKRAYAVMQYLRQSLLLSADEIRSMGYGADRPVDSNQTADGRAKNRRIDVIIMQ